MSEVLAPTTTPDVPQARAVQGLEEIAPAWPSEPPGRAARGEYWDLAACAWRRCEEDDLPA